MKTEKFFRSAVRLAGDITKKSLLAALILYLGTQSYDCLYRASNRLDPSEKRAEFQQEFGFPIDGHEEDVEKRKHSLSRIVEVLYKEKLERPFQIKSLEIVSDNILKRDFVHQSVHLIANGYSGYQVHGFMGLKGAIYPGTIHHEIKHAKTDEILEKHPEFKWKWLNLSRDKNGNSLYFYESRLKSTVFRIRGLDDLAIPEGFDFTDNLNLGFLGSSARRDYYEDIAEVCEFAEVNPVFFHDLLYKDKNPNIIGKVKLAEEYKLVPEGFREFVKIIKSYHEASDKEDAWRFLRDSRNFLIKYPGTTYGLELRNLRGRTFEIFDLGLKNGLEKAVEEYKQGLKGSWISYERYSLALGKISDLYGIMDDKQKAFLYQEAGQRYIDGYNSADFKIVIHGVNDFLAANGEKF